MKEAGNTLIDIYGVVYEPWWQSTAWYIFLILVICALLSFSVYYLYHKGFFKKKLSFDKQALYDLEVLEKKSAVGNDQIKQAYFQLTMILKVYLVHRYKIFLYDKSDIEIMDMIASMVTVQEKQIMHTFFKRAFAIKFASEQVDAVVLHNDILSVQALIIDTMKTFEKVERS